ncbi:hypothetical protein GCM10023206_19430 [Acinetobacter puyangensis]|uniref:Uncharacterized protein n=1 Tax=Acinetobacter puyangensis TaxID=1096779 RepID=A0A240ED69_9GAMM|nr:hypothetical protein [Acinetobacter puyangensis]SNX46642.1 hypothetical protein SAMN05421731_11455 [Acinetobacter puyangensis]
MSSKNQLNVEQQKEYAMYPVQEIQRLYEIHQHYQMLLIQIDQLKVENYSLRQEILELNKNAANNKAD